MAVAPLHPIHTLAHHRPLKQVNLHKCVGQSSRVRSDCSRCHVDTPLCSTPHTAPQLQPSTSTAQSPAVTGHSARRIFTSSSPPPGEHPACTRGKRPAIMYCFEGPAVPPPIPTKNPHQIINSRQPSRQATCSVPEQRKVRYDATLINRRSTPTVVGSSHVYLSTPKAPVPPNSENGSPAQPVGGPAFRRGVLLHLLWHCRISSSAAARCSHGCSLEHRQFLCTCPVMHPCGGAIIRGQVTPCHNLYASTNPRRGPRLTSRLPRSRPLQPEQQRALSPRQKTITADEPAATWTCDPRPPPGANVTHVRDPGHARAHPPTHPRPIQGQRAPLGPA